MATVNAASVANSMPRDQKVQKYADSGYYPLWYNNKAKETIPPAELPGVQDKDSDVERNRAWKEIQSALIYCIIKHVENVQTLLNALQESGGVLFQNPPLFFLVSVPF